MNKQSLVGMVAAGGLILQIVIGFALAGSGAPASSVLFVPHMAIGITGLALIAFLAGRIFYSSSNAIKLLYLITFLITLAQVALGFRILEVPEQQLVMGHQGAAILILVLIGLSEMLAARKRRKSA